ncbi:MAG: DUF86 domain-containing protein [bacterium]|nr:DUF86 domain-containing protein [bacterium]
MSKRELKLYLTDIVDSIKKIERYVRKLSFSKLKKDDKTIDAVVRNIIIIGEAVNNIPDKIKTVNPDIAWRQAAGMRNKVTHEYFGIDEETLWQTIKEDLPVLKKQIIKLLKETL